MHRITSFHFIHFMLESAILFTSFKREISSKIRHQKKNRQNQHQLRQEKRKKLEGIWQNMLKTCTQKVNEVLFHRIKLIKNLTFKPTGPTLLPLFACVRARKYTYFRTRMSLPHCGIVVSYTFIIRPTVKRPHHIFPVLHIICRALLIYGLLFLARSKRR